MVNTIQTRDEAFQHLSSELGSRFTPELFAYLDEMGFVRDVILRAEEPESLVREAKRVWKAAAPSGSKAEPAGILDREWQAYLQTKDGLLGMGYFMKLHGLSRVVAEEVLRGVKHPEYEADRPPDIPPDRQASSLRILRLWTISTLLAKQAASELAVQEFRAQHLGGGLVDRSDIRRWMRDQTEQNGGSAYWYQIPFVRDDDGDFVATMPRGVAVAGDSMVSDMQGRYGTDWTFRTIDYVEQFGGRDIQIVSKSGALPRLLQIVRDLVERYPWTEAQTTTFVLTGHIPVVKNQLETKVLMDSEKPLTTRIEMRIDPITPPADVLYEYKMIRSGMIGRGKARSLSVKNWRLVLFNAEVPYGWSWERKRLKWNNEYPADRDPGYQYSSRRNFSRDVRKATERVAKTGYLQVETAEPTHDMLPPVYEGEGIH